MKKTWKTFLAATAFSIAAMSLAADQEAPPSLAAPPAQLPIELPPSTARSSASIAPERMRSWIPPVPTPIAARTPRAISPIKQPITPDPLPLIYVAHQPQPSRPQFAQGPRILITPLPAFTPRIPNLLTNNKRAQQNVPNPIIIPAAAIVTPTVNNLQGTSDLPPLPPFAREIQIEIAPLPAPLPFDREPYLQSPAAPDDADPPANSREPSPIRPALK